MYNKRRVGDLGAEVKYSVELIDREERIELCPTQRRQRRGGQSATKTRPDLIIN